MRFQFRQTTVAGGMTVGIGGVIATVTAADAKEWLELVVEFAPIALCGWLLYVLYSLEKQHDDCRDALIAVNADLADLRVELAALKARQDMETDDGK